MVIEWVFGIFEGIQNKAHKNIDVAIFGFVIL